MQNHVNFLTFIIENITQIIYYTYAILFILYILYIILYIFHIYIYIFFLWLHPQHVEVPRLGTECKPQLLPKEQLQQCWTL